MMIPQLKIQSPQKTTPLLRGLFRAAILSIATAAATLASSAEAANCIPLAPADADYVVSGPSGLKLAASKNRDCVINVGDLAVFRFDGIKPAGWELFRIAAANGAQVGAGQTYTNYVQIAGPVGGLNPNIVRAGGWSSPNNFVKAQLPTRKATFTGVLPGVYTVEIRFSVSLRNRQNQVSIVEYSGVGAPINTVAVKYKITVQAPPVVAPNLPQDLVGRTFVSPEVYW